MWNSSLPVAAGAAGIDQGANVRIARRDHAGEWGIDSLKRLQLLQSLHVGLRGLQAGLLGCVVSGGVVRFLLGNRIGFQQAL